MAAALVRDINTCLREVHVFVDLSDVQHVRASLRTRYCRPVVYLSDTSLSYPAFVSPTMFSSSFFSFFLLSFFLFFSFFFLFVVSCSFQQ